MGRGQGHGLAQPIPHPEAVRKENLPDVADGNCRVADVEIGGHLREAAGVESFLEQNLQRVRVLREVGAAIVHRGHRGDVAGAGQAEGLEHEPLGEAPKHAADVRPGQLALRGDQRLGNRESEGRRMTGEVQLRIDVAADRQGRFVAMQHGIAAAGHVEIDEVGGHRVAGDGCVESLPRVKTEVLPLHRREPHASERPMVDDHGLLPRRLEKAVVERYVILRLAEPGQRELQHAGEHLVGLVIGLLLPGELLEVEVQRTVVAGHRVEAGDGLRRQKRADARA